MLTLDHHPFLVLPNVYVNFASEADITLQAHQLQRQKGDPPTRRPLAVPYVVDETAELAWQCRMVFKWLFIGKSNSSWQYSGGRRGFR